MYGAGADTLEGLGACVGRRHAAVSDAGDGGVAGEDGGLCSSMCNGHLLGPCHQVVLLTHKTGHNSS
jgi:hypothetical protein